MPFFICSNCGYIENTVWSHYWQQMVDGLPPLCSACDPKIGQWHNRFERMLPTAVTVAEIRRGTPGHPLVDDAGHYLTGIALPEIPKEHHGTEAS